MVLSCFLILLPVHYVLGKIVVTDYSHYSHLDISFQDFCCIVKGKLLIRKVARNTKHCLINMGISYLQYSIGTMGVYWYYGIMMKSTNVSISKCINIPSGMVWSHSPKDGWEW